MGEERGERGEGSVKGLVIKVGDKEVVIDRKVLRVLHRYVSTEMGLEELARELGLEGWEEAYEFVKKVPAWIMWTPSELWEE